MEVGIGLLFRCTTLLDGLDKFSEILIKLPPRKLLTQRRQIQPGALIRKGWADFLNFFL
jgi:hypothetical protein